MGIEYLSALKGEAESAFATENGAHSFSDIRAVDAQLSIAQMMHDVNENRARVQTQLSQVLGRKSDGTRLSFGAHLRGDGVALDDAASPADDVLQDLLELCMGGSASGAGSTEDGSSSTTTAVAVQAGHGARFSAGQAVMVEGTGADGVNEISIIESITTDVLTLKIALSNAPTNGDRIYNSYTSYVDPSATATWQFQAIRDDAALIYLLLGCVGGFALQNLLSVQDLPRVNFDLFCTSWEEDSATLAAGTYDGADLLGTTSPMEIHYQTHGTTDRNLISCSALDVVPGMGWTPLNARGNGDIQHVDRVRMTQLAPTASFTADPSSAFHAAHTARTDKLLAIMFGRTPGSSWCVEVPKAELMAVPTPGAHADQLAQQVQLRAHEDDCGAGASALELSNIRIHRL